MCSKQYLLHVTDVARWPAALSNLGNLVTLGEGEQVVVLVNGTAIYALQGENDWTQAMHQAVEGGVTIYACQRALTNHSFSLDLLPTWLELVPAALPAERQFQAEGPWPTSSRSAREPRAA
ncbi:MAG: CoA biosynthesis protein CoaBC [Buchananella hordeovulneris]|nr:CoA biosynthesis protein CoaBC [Buchananella hordeovulneris]